MAFVVMCLWGCDSGPANTATDVQTVTDSSVQQVPITLADSSRKGPHASGDPHASLTPDKHAQVALQHLAEGRPDEAMNTLNQAIGKFPQSASLHGVRGSVLLEQGQSAAALADLNKAVQLDPHNPVYLTNRAQAYRSFDRTDEAMADLDSAIELDTSFIAARFNRGSLAFKAGKYPQALQDFDACIAADPQSAAPYFNRASVHEAMGNRTRAIADLKHFLKIATSDEWKDVAEKLLQQWQEQTPANQQDAS